MHDERWTGPGQAPVSRRNLLAGTGGLALTTALGGRPARAEEERIVVATWGGDYANLLRKNIDEPVLKPRGIEVVQDLGDQLPRIAKVYAQRRLPRGTVDVVCAEAPFAYRMGDSGLLEKIDESNVPNLKHVRPDLRSEFYAPHIYSVQVLIYNPDKVGDPPKSFGDLMDPKYKGKVGFPDPNFLFVMMGAALYGSGNASDFDKAKELMEKLNANGLRLYPSTDSIAAAMKSGEIDVGVIWLARVHMWQNGGFPIKASFPKEGCIAYVATMTVPKNAPNKKGGLEYLNAMLEPQPEIAFAQDMGYLPPRTDTQLPGKLGEELALPADLKTVVPDYPYVTKVQSDIADWWKKTIQRG